jgi:hypothetical protein
MAVDITRNVLRAGMSRADVERILGKPTDPSKVAYQYELGMCSGLRFDFDVLYISFDADGIYQRAEILQH